MEVQSQPEAGFVERMFVYHYRLRDRYNRKVVSLAVLGDERASWRPDRYRHELCGCTLEFRFPIVKLIDYSDRMEDLERSSNPFAMLVLAHLKSLETKGDTANRYAWKFRLVKGMYTRGRSAEQVRNLFKFIDWMIDLPPELEKQFTEQLSQYEEEKHMPYVTSVERLAREQGREQGLLEGIEAILQTRFGARSESVLSEIRQLSNVEILGRVLRRAQTVEHPEDLSVLWSDSGEEHGGAGSS